MYGSSQNFEDLMSMAKRNAAEAKRKASNLNLSDGRPRKADPKQVKLKEGVAKFLAKQAEEEKRKKELDKIKKEKLLQLRQQDRKATNRVRKMLSMTKSANKSCVDDARECLNESVAAQGEIQPDEDDYGYTSNYADMMHKKMMEKYKSIPVKPAFPQERTVPVPKHQSLSNGTGWRKHGSSHDQEEERGYSSPEPERKERHEERPPTSNKKPAKPNRPPPPDFHELLKMAAEKKFEPVAPLKPVVDKKGELDEFEFGRPMTAKEKKAYLAEKEMKDRLARRMEGKEPKSDKNNNSSNASNGDNKNGKMPSFKIPKARSNEDASPSAAPPSKKPRVIEPEPSISNRPAKESPKPFRPTEPSANGGSVKSSSQPNSKLNGVRPSTSSSNGASSSSRPPERPLKQSSTPSPAQTSKSSRGDPQRDRPSSASHQPKPDVKAEKVLQVKKELIKEEPRYLSAFEGNRKRDKERERESLKKQPLLSKDSNKPRPGSSRDMQSSNREEKSYDSRDKVRPSPAHKMSPPDDRDRNRLLKGRERDDVRPTPRRDVAPPRRDLGHAPRRDAPMKGPPRMRDDSPPRMRPPSHKPFRGRAVIDSEDEYDSEMDDFIDDSEVDMGNISAEISRIFKYDRRKYATYNEESDDECMESSVAEQLREEQRSLRIGIQEDLEDMAREEEEKRQMKMKMLKKKR